MLKCTEVFKEFGDTKYGFRERWLNKDFVVGLYEDTAILRNLKEGYLTLPPNIKQDVKFTRVNINRGQTGLDITVIGNPEDINQGLIR